MHSSVSLLALAGSAAAQIRGFNYGTMFSDNSARFQSDFENDFKAAAALPGIGGFSSARLYTMIQAYSTNDVVSALPAAAATNTSLLLGMWASAGQDAFNNELAALKTAISQYPDLVDQIVGLSVGSEDLYRISPTGIENKSGVGADPETLVSYISQVRQALSGTAWSGIKIGHVDTWTAYVNGSNNAVIEAIDWLGVDEYPYFQTVDANAIGNAETLFFNAYDATVGAAQGKEVWVTETGWPVSGPASGAAIASTQNAESYWKQVACQIMGGDRSVNTWWYQLEDGSSPNFAVVSAPGSAPLYDLSCSQSDKNASGTSSSSSSSSSSPSSVAGTASAESASQTGSYSGSGSSSNGTASSSASATHTGTASSSGASSTSTAASTTESGSSSGVGGGSSGGSGGSGGSSEPGQSSSSSSTAESTASSTPSQYTGGAQSLVINTCAALLLAAGTVMAVL